MNAIIGAVVELNEILERLKKVSTYDLAWVRGGLGDRSINLLNGMFSPSVSDNQANKELFQLNMERELKYSRGARELATGFVFLWVSHRGLCSAQAKGTND